MSVSSRRFAVTGATGFLGGALARRLSLEGHDVVGLGRNVAAGRQLVADGVHFRPGELAGRSPTPIAGISEGVDAVIHCAGLSSDWGTRAAFTDANVLATRRVLDAAALAGARHFVLISSSSVYFRYCDQQQTREDVDLPRPVNAYAASKAAAERLVLGDSRLPTTIVRPRGLYGKGDTSLLPRLLEACDRGPLPLLRGGHAVIDLTHVDDAVGAIVAILKTPPAQAARIFNVSGGEALPIRRIVEDAAARTGRHPRWRRLPWAACRVGLQTAETVHRLAGSRAGPVITTYAAGLFAFNQTLDIGAIAAATGWRPGVTFASGLERTFACLGAE